MTLKCVMKRTETDASVSVSEAELRLDEGPGRTALWFVGVLANCG